MPLKTNEQLHFHNVHGCNIVLKNNNTLACLENGLESGSVLTDRPVMILERVVFQIKKTANRIGDLSIGFTSHDPSNISETIDDFEVFVSKSIMFELLPYSVIKDDYIISFVADNNGHVYYSVNNGMKTYIGNVNISLKLWAIIDLFSNVTEIELLGSGFSLLNIERKMIEKAKSQKIFFREMCGDYGCLSKDRTIAYNNQSVDYTYVFSNRSLQFNEKIIIRFNKYCNDLGTTLEYGITSTDPFKVSPNDFGVHNKDVLKFPDLVEFKDGNNYKSDDIIIFVITDGKFMALKNCALQVCCLDIDIRQPLWLFLKLNKAVCEISIKRSSTEDYCHILTEQNFEKVLSVSSKDVESGVCTTSINSFNMVNPCRICLEKPVTIAIYPCGHLCMCYECAQNGWSCKKIIKCLLCKSYILDLVKVLSLSDIIQNFSSCSYAVWINNAIILNQQCLFCFVNTVNCIFYSCGHMCMCYKCAKYTWGRKRLGQCPICKTVIKDAIKAFY